MRARPHLVAAAVAVGIALAGSPSAADAQHASLRAVPSERDAGADEIDALFDASYGLDDEFAAADPLEGANRHLLRFNQAVHRYALDPLTEAYRFAVPAPVRVGIRRFFFNLNAPVVFANDIFQLRFRDAAETVGCFVLNSTVGMGGLFDAGAEAGWKIRHADFGQTLARVGIDSGPYLVVPLLGPSTLRDGIGVLVDLGLHPVTYLLGPGQLLVLGGGEGFATLEANSDALEALEESSVDYYAALRSAYFQHRRAVIQGEEDPDGSLTRWRRPE